MNISADSKLWRWYLRYEKNGGRRRNPENLCRFIRVCFIWAPIRELFCGSILNDEDHSKEPPNILLLLVFGIIDAAAWGVGISIRDEGLWHLSVTLFYVALILAAAIAGSVAIGKTWLWSKEKAQNKEWYYTGRRGKFCPIITVVNEKRRS